MVKCYLLINTQIFAARKAHVINLLHMRKRIKIGKTIGLVYNKYKQ